MSQPGKFLKISCKFTDNPLKRGNEKKKPTVGSLLFTDSFTLKLVNKQLKYLNRNFGLFNRAKSGFIIELPKNKSA